MNAKKLFNEAKINGECSTIVENLSDTEMQILLEECFHVECRIEGEKKLYIISN